MKTSDCANILGITLMTEYLKGNRWHFKWDETVILKICIVTKIINILYTAIPAITLENGDNAIYCEYLNNSTHTSTMVHTAGTAH